MALLNLLICAYLLVQGWFAPSYLSVQIFAVEVVKVRGSRIDRPRKDTPSVNA
jgi:hypothetical protein